ncbi:radical SAM protein [Clostridium cellulovorans]|uniref:Radical SAM domain-containing protein n=1 Tax=Clostridium cellulovorans (strain ATCC 35296 / DSM 3052 / OCM 3 / 743B) TaxID=573061 RepID=D9SWF6_CLOC7|nr:radical SAM protein [Clostridium cellulovorans]ADL53238.1 radical SAM domain-containing protein [Clostridium cellulovorans 743B]
MTIGLIDVDSKIPNLALMKISSFYKLQGEKVEFVQPNTEYEKIFASAIFTRSKYKCEELIQKYGDKIEIGGTGWDINKVLPGKIEYSKPDYDLYSAEEIASRMRGIMTKERKLQKATEIVNAGMGFTSRGCIRECGFCFVPKKEGKFHNVAEIKDIINPRSNIIILHDNNITADPNCIDKLVEIKERGLIVDINQGCDIRLMNDDIAQAMGQVKHLRSLHYTWDLMAFEDKVIEGIKTLSKFIKPYRHMCFTLVGYNTTFEEDMYRFRKLRELKVDPFVMIYNQKKDIRLKHFARWVNSRIYKSCTWEEYEPWKKAQLEYLQVNMI